MFGISTALGAIGGIAGGLINSHSQRSINNKNINEARRAEQASQAFAREQMSFQKEMSNTAYQRATADMKKAGINPMLAYMQGGASSPQGASGSAQMARLDSERMGDALTSGINSAIDTTRLKKELKETDSRISLQDAQKTQSKAQASLQNSLKTQSEAQASLLNTSAKKQAEEIKNIKKTGKILSHQEKVIGTKAAFDIDKTKLDHKMLNYDAINQRVQSGLGTLGTAMGIMPNIGGKLMRRSGGVVDKKTGEFFRPN